MRLSAAFFIFGVASIVCAAPRPGNHTEPGNEDNKELPLPGLVELGLSEITPTPRNWRVSQKLDVYHRHHNSGAVPTTAGKSFAIQVLARFFDAETTKRDLRISGINVKGVFRGLIGSETNKVVPFEFFNHPLCGSGQKFVGYVNTRLASDVQIRDSQNVKVYPFARRRTGA
ncbi:hypothetical protein J3R30DRAFT_2697534 [Lentinula aciculospora]|uniref:Uncharacterized protein n=1 Tax=Lentinula aciculospora TaxID=153920 RepID=A0A9W9ABI4_9AGAR|nr:hypothetical protein J3R30DRAFT_2697534 [Lentinula aciculospora]